MRYTEAFLPTQAPTHLSAKTDILGMSVTGTVSNHCCIVNLLLIQELSFYCSHQIMPPWFILLASRPF